MKKVFFNKALVTVMMIFTVFSLGAQTSSLTLEAEEALISEGWIETEYAGYSGTGYVNTVNETEAYVEWSTDCPGGGARCVLTFANGGTNRPMAVLVNGNTQVASMNFPSVGWTSWQTAEEVITLSPGQNTIRLVSLTSEGAPNLDKMELIFDVPGKLTGDADNNGVVDIIDALKTAQYYVGLTVPGFVTENADFNQDQTITIVDALMIAQFYVGLITTPEPTATPVVTPLGDITIFIAGDSTVQSYPASYAPQAGWGQMLPEYVTSLAKVDNRAIGGRTARRFIDEGFLNDIWRDIQPGDWLLVQFGTNDGHPTATYTLNGQVIPYYLDPQTDFKYYLRMYIDGARARGVNIVLVSPPPRNSAYCTGGNGTGAHAQAMRELATAEGVPLVDLNMITVNYLKAICPPPEPEDFFLIRTDGSVDGTHFQENGARKLAGFIVQTLREQSVPLAAYFK